MKNVYERPVMMAEVYKTNDYCAVCGDTVTLDNLILDDKCQYYSDKNFFDPLWSPGLGFKKEDLYHEFDGVATTQSPGICNPGTCASKMQPIWKCTCTDHPGETWYLEWSHHYSVHDNNGRNGDTFFLYKEAGTDSNNPNGFDITGNSTSWPAKESRSDYNVARVVYRHGESVVANS